MILYRALYPNSTPFKNRIQVPIKPSRYLEVFPGGSLSYLGQLLKHYGSPTHIAPRTPIMFPSETKVPTPPFTRYCFNRLVDTDLTYDLILTSPQDESKIISLLAAHSIHVTFKDRP